MGRMMAAAVALMLAGCSSAEERAAQAEQQGNRDLEIEARARVLEQLRDPSSAEFSEVGVYLGSDGKKRVCGYVNADNAFGGKAGRKRFVAGPNEAFLAEGENEDAVLLAATQACLAPQPQ